MIEPAGRGRTAQLSGIPLPNQTDKTMTSSRLALYVAITLATMSVLPAAHAQSAADQRTISDFLECKLSEKQITRFMDRIDNNAVSGLSRQAGKSGAITLGWEAQKPVRAWGTKSTVVAMLSPHEMLMAIPAPKGGELDMAKQWAERIGGMREDAGVVSMREHMNWHGADYRKAGSGHETRLLVDQKETPGWILLGCHYQEATLGGLQ
ncbi:hypothetical protein [Paraburkholderia sp. SIMBA_054]|uniref:hypothetical protein n=1 Tax=Paraburkholderia sp. SIMBA_054 TaxID=3085795 RepID=UPI00397D8053